MLLWRYLSVDSWRRLESDRRLTLTRLAGFNDAFECAVPMVAHVLRGALAERSLEELSNIAARQRLAWASCWFADEHESIAMWDLYVGSGEPGVALAILYVDLDEARPQGVGLAPVHYVRTNDASAEIAMDRPELWPFIKLWGFRHEQEVRLLAPDGHANVDVPDPSRPWARLRDVDLAQLVRYARVFAPNASEEHELQQQVASWAPQAEVDRSLAYPLVFQGDWRYGFQPGGTDWRARTAEIAPKNP